MLKIPVRKEFLFSILIIATVFFESSSQSLEIIKFEKLEQIIQHRKKVDEITVFNFWATWCRPCIEEMPIFEEIARVYANDIKLIFVSLDFADIANSRVIPFLEKREIQSRVLLLDDTKYHTWIDKVYPTWSGGIPATLIIDRKGEVHFYEKQLEKLELNSLIINFINQTKK